MVQGDLLRDLPEWLEEFTEILVDERVPKGHTRKLFSQIRCRIHEKSGIGQAQYSYSLPGGPKLRNSQEDQGDKGSLQKTHWQSCTSSTKFGVLMTARNNHRYAVVVKDLATQWIQAYPCKTKTSQETEKIHKGSSSRQKSRKSFTLNIPCNLAKPVKNDHGIIARQRLIVLRQMALLKERYAESG